MTVKTAGTLFEREPPARDRAMTIQQDKPMNPTQTAAADETYYVTSIIAVMRTTGGWYLRKRKGVRPALWASLERGTFAAATPKRLVEWLHAKYPGYSTGERDFLRLAEAIIAELRYHDHGLRVLTDESIGSI